MKPMKVLIGEGDTVPRRLLEKSVRVWGFEPVACADGEQALQALQNLSTPQLAILDWALPGRSGREICETIQSTPARSCVYTILLTTKRRNHELLKALESGADDYVIKPFLPQELESRLRAGKRVVALQAQLASAREALAFHARHDFVTGLWNRAGILESLRRELGRARRSDEPLCVVMADVDHLRRVNDAYGNAAGDEVLRKIAKRVRRSLRLYDCTGRYSGEEFLFVLASCNGSEGVTAAKRIRECIGAEPIETARGPVPVTITLGVASSAEGAELDEHGLIRAAESALRRAKETGRNRVESATSADLALASQTEVSPSNSVQGDLEDGEDDLAVPNLADGGLPEPSALAQHPRWRAEDGGELFQIAS